MNEFGRHVATPIAPHQIEQFQRLIAQLFQCCQERLQYQCERFGLPDAELRCLLLFADQRYLTPKDIAHRLNVVKSRVTKIINGMIQKGLLQRIKDPEDSRISLLSLTPEGHKKVGEINAFLTSTHQQVLAQIHPDQRGALLTNLELLRVSMEAVKEMMI